MKKTKEKETIFAGSKVIVNDQALASTFSNKGNFGAFVNGKLELSIEEAVYLNERKELKIYDKKGKELKFHELLEMAKKKVIIKNQLELKTYEENGVEKIKEVLNECAKNKFFLFFCLS